MRLALGTVQFGLRYGVANTHGQVAPDEILAILDTARAAGIDTLDTAIAYGDSETQLGRSKAGDFRIVSKLPKLEPGDDIEAMVRASVGRLGVGALDGLLLHRSEDLVGDGAEAVYGALQSVKEQGLVRKIGISIYDPAELEAIVPRFRIDIVQAPYNVLDQRLSSSGWLDRVKAAGVEVHTRSAFLQGLLLMPASRRPAYFMRWSDLWSRWDRWLADNGLSALHVALGAVLSDRRVDRVVVGVDSSSQLRDIITAAESGPVAAPDLASQDLDLLNPARWKLN